MDINIKELKESQEIIQAFAEAHDIAGEARQPLSSVHLLLAFFTFPNRAQILFKERGIGEDTILKAIRGEEEVEEQQELLSKVRQRAHEIAAAVNSPEVDCLHVLIMLTRLRDACAYKVLERTGISLASLRNLAMSYVASSYLPRRYRCLNVPPEKLGAETLAPPVVNDKVRQVALPYALSPPAAITEALFAQRETAPSEEQEFAPEVAEPLESLECAIELQDVLFLDNDDEATLTPESLENENSRREFYPELTQETGLNLDEARAFVPFELAQVAPTLAAYGVNLTEKARLGELDMVLGRERELTQVIDILSKRRANNPLLVGPPGVGKTAIVEGLALKLLQKDPDLEAFTGRLVVALDASSLLAGTSLRGSFSERLLAIKEEVLACKQKVIVFIDEIHTLIGAGNSGDGAQDAASELKVALARGDFPCIGATTLEEFKKYIEKDAALERRFTPVYIEEPTPDEALLILEGGVKPYADHHGVVYSLEAIQAAVRLTYRFILERKLPDKAFSVLDLAGARAKRQGKTQVESLDVARVVHEWSNVPLERLMATEAKRLAKAETLLSEKFIGHKNVVSSVCNALKRGLAGFNKERPMGSFLFLGPTGVGKTELVKVLAEFLFGKSEAILRVDMSEFSEKHSVSRLLGAQPGYVGYEEGGQLTEAIRKRPFQIVLFDEIEKAHNDVLALLLQILDEGHLTDARGRKVNFVDTLIILTSNLGAEHFSDLERPTLGFLQTSEPLEIKDPQALQEKILNSVRHKFVPELWSRLDERLVFMPLTAEEVGLIARLQLKKLHKVLFAEKQVSLHWTSGVIDFLLRHGGYTKELGARGMRQAVQRHIEVPLAERMFKGKIKPQDLIVVDRAKEGDSLIFAKRR